MNTQDTQVDYRGARGSNTGDAFHELWAVRQALKLLDPSSGLTAIKVEGVPDGASYNVSWDGVDCTLLFGGENLADSEYVKLQQQRYSASNPNKRWTVARVCSGRNGKPSTSLIRKLGNAFRSLIKVRDGKDINSIKISLVTNQPISPELTETMALAARDGVPDEFKQTWKTGGQKLHRLFKASGLTPAKFKQFAKVIDFCGYSGSRFSLEDKILGEITKWQDTEFSETSRRLREYVRNRMLPEAARELITKQMVLIQFGVSDEHALLPCPSEIKPIHDPVPRGASQDVAETMLQGTQRICLHGAAGVGKTTALQEISTLLPDGSEMIIFDCYGGGTYQDASRLRHSPRAAFMQLSNELAEHLRLPMFLVPNSTGDHAKAFRRRLEIAADMIEKVNPKGLLVIAIDAADNSITAAQNNVPSNTSFVTELMTFSDLPSNVHVIVSVRTGRLDELNPPLEFEHIELTPFTEDETAKNVERYWLAPHGWVEEFHYLSGGVPRVQAYAFEYSSIGRNNALEILQPGGKLLSQIFDDLFQMALSKSGVQASIGKVCAGLSVLPRPIPVEELAHVLKFTVSQVVDVCADLAPGVRKHNSFLSFSDEDFEDYVREKGRDFEEVVQATAAERSLTYVSSDEYAACNVAHLLFVAGRHDDLLDLVERDPEPNATVVPDPVIRREIHDQRLLTAIRVCQKAGDTERALRFVLIGARAKQSSESTRSLLAEFPRLAVRYAKESASRLILGNPDEVANHGSIILQSLAQDAIKGDRISFREGRRSYEAWVQALKDNNKAELGDYRHDEFWTIKPQDVAAAIFGMAVLEGAAAAIGHLSRCSPFRFFLRVAKEFVNRMLIEQRFDMAQEIASKCSTWRAVFLLVPLANAGQTIDHNRLALGLTALKKRFRLDADMLISDHRNSEISPFVLDNVLSGVEILVGHGVQTDLVESILSPFLNSDLRRLDKRHQDEAPLLDAIFRSICLSEAISGKEVAAMDMLLPRPEQPGEEQIVNTPTQHELEHDRGLKELISVIAPVYSRRAQIIVAAGRRSASNKIALVGVETGFNLNAWHLDRRNNAKEFLLNVSDGLGVFLALGADAKDVFKFAKKLHGNSMSSTRRLCERFSMISSLHDELSCEITRGVEATVSERVRASDKSRCLAEYAEMLIPISPDDADVVFNLAIEASNEFDSGVMEQIRFFSVLIDHEKSVVSQEDLRSQASMLAEIINDAAIRLGDEEDFPWRDAMASIACLDVPTALACVARWHDYQWEGISSTLPTVIHVALTTDQINSAQAAALLSLFDRVPPELLISILQRATDEAGSAASEIAEEFAHDCLVDRLTCFAELEPLITQYGQGEWSRQFTKQSEFRKTLPIVFSESANYEHTSTAISSDIINGHYWGEATLTVPSKLLTESRIVLAQSRSAGEYSSLSEVLSSASKAVPVRHRCQHLDALAAVLGHDPDDQILDAILSSADKWKGQLAVQQWCKDNLPRLLTEHLPRFEGYLPWEDNRLGPAMNLAGLSGSLAQDVLLNGIERNSKNLDAHTIFLLAGRIVVCMEQEESAQLCAWYLERVLAHIPENYREAIDSNDLPVTATSSMARFLYTYMSDVDLRLRWRAAHALRRLARLGEDETLDETVSQYSRCTEHSFRAGNAPFYWRAARLWLVIALDRIAKETPAAAKRYSQNLLDICFDEDFPHILVREFAADACRGLVASGYLEFGDKEKSKMERVNEALIVTETDHWIPSESFESFEMSKHHLRFDFDHLDTLRYWYNEWLSIFPDLKPEEFIIEAESWIVDNWGVDDKEDLRYRDPRPKRFNDQSFASWGNSHGSLPTLEKYHNHLEWHAMWCAAARFIRTHRVNKDNYRDYNELKERISRDKLTYSPMWLSDLVGPAPLQTHRWQPPVENLDSWLRNIDDDAFLQELFPDDRDEWVVVSADIDARYHDRREEVKIFTGLVSPMTAHSLVRALQTADSHQDFYIPQDENDTQINEQDYKLEAWLAYSNSDLLYDSKDPYRNGVKYPQGLPGAAVTQVLNLEQRYSYGRLQWFCRGSNSPSFQYEAWGEKEPEDGRFHIYGNNVVCNGYRTLVRKEALANFLCKVGRDLIIEIRVTRHGRRKPGRSYDTEDDERAVYDRIVVLRRDGSIEAAERNFEAWRDDNTRTRTE